ncbi:MAG: hypothetical protein IJG15_06070, partial [Lachnospiraceae bacterium]|nr:hypothetical protein [Lachnospiraceae bacterium]
MIVISLFFLPPAARRTASTAPARQPDPEHSLKASRTGLPAGFLLIRLFLLFQLLRFLLFQLQLFLLFLCGGLRRL